MQGVDISRGRSPTPLDSPHLRKLAVQAYKAMETELFYSEKSKDFSPIKRMSEDKLFFV